MQTPNPAAAMVQGIINAIYSGNYPWYWPAGARNKAIDAFAYGTEFLPLVASATTANQIAINADSAFLIVSACLVETDTTDLSFLAQHPLLFQLSDTGSGRYLSNIAIHADNYFGTAERPFIWTEYGCPKILAPNSTFSVQAQNLEATNRNVRVAFHGIKIFSFVPSLSAASQS